MKNSNDLKCSKSVISIHVSFLIITTLLGLATFNAKAQGNGNDTPVVYNINKETGKSRGYDNLYSADYSRFKNTTGLEIKGTMNVIPAEIFNFSDLEELNVNSSEITSMPVDIRKLYNLRVLNLGNTSINELPEEISQLKHLKEIHLPFSYWAFRLNEVKKITRANIILE